MGVLCVALLYLWHKATAENKSLKSRYGSIINEEEHLATIISEQRAREAESSKEQGIIDNLKAESTALYNQIANLEVDVLLNEVGLYKPKFDLDSSEDYRRRLDLCYAAAADLIKSKKAVSCPGNMTLDGSLSKGQKMMNNIVKLMLRAFNGECDACIAKVKWDNVQRMEDRIKKAFEVVNKSSESYNSSITWKYMESRLDELHLEYELEVKKNEEKEEQRRIKEEMREEEKARREIEKAKEDAEKEEARYQSALEKARMELSKATDAKKDVLAEKVAQLEEQLKKAHEMKVRAISRAQMTKSGHVYIISNIGSFGENMFKIGMTRRLEPLDRVKELGDASVPFSFDVHGMFFSENAPALENMLHKAFADKRVNLVNLRKEFFNLSLHDIEGWAGENSHNLKLTKLAEAREWRETQAIKAKGIAAIIDASNQMVTATELKSSNEEDD